MSQLRRLLAIFMIVVLFTLLAPVVSYAQDAEPVHLQITEVELNPQTGPQRIQWIEFFNPTNDTFTVLVTVTTARGAPTFEAGAATFSPGYAVLTIFEFVSEPRVKVHGELGFPKNGTSLVVYVDGREIARTPEISDTFSDSRTWQYDHESRRWAFAESTMNWYASNIEERSIDAITSLRPLARYEAKDSAYLRSMDWSQDTLVYSAEINGRVDIWSIDTADISAKPQRLEFGQEIFTPEGPRLNHDASKLLFIGATAPPGSPDRLPALYVSNADGTELRQIALNVTRADWVNATAILYSQKELIDSAADAGTLFVFLNLETGEELVKREPGSLWLAEVSPSCKLALAIRPVNYYESEYVIVELSSFEVRKLDVHVATEHYWGGGYSQQEEFHWAADDSHLFYINPEAFGAVSIYRDENAGVYKSDSKIVLRTFDPNNIDYSGNRLAYVANPVLGVDGKSIAFLYPGDHNRDFPAQIMMGQLAVTVPEFGSIVLALMMATGMAGAVIIAYRLRAA